MEHEAKAAWKWKQFTGERVEEERSLAEGFGRRPQLAGEEWPEECGGAEDEEGKEASLPGPQG